MRVLFLCSEFEGVIKTGGLADASRGLATEMQKLGHEVRVLLPRYGSLYSVPVEENWQSVYFALGGQAQGCAVRTVLNSEVPLALIEHHDYFGRPRPYDDGQHGYPDNALRFAFFCKAALQFCVDTGWVPDLIHGHDWQTGIAAYYLKQFYQQALPGTKMLFTIHNGAYQQALSAADRAQTEVDPSTAMAGSSMLALGLAYADKVNTVSKGYATELLTEPAANGLAALYQARGTDFSGILNGCDYEQWDPATDLYLTAQYSHTKLKGKLACKTELKQRYGLEQNTAPLFVLVSRVTEQKGFAYLLPALEQWLGDADAQVLMMGTGDQAYIGRLQALNDKFPGRFVFVEGFNEALSHQLEAAGDFFLMPSLFEPCGLNQIYSLRYGTVPLVRLTGGLKDTVRDLTDSEPTGIGFVEPTAQALLEALNRALQLYQQPAWYKEVQQRGMQQRFGWAESAVQYQVLYQQLQA
ncbi:glycogen synthase [Rheinheimera sp. 1928-s]|uniref:glycogen synthase n=1 Tax=Rheinheimera sp. 1928-s TaxID=3033803 RepID=UPI002626EBF0|nr:glycogen synthase [Rheinheimera sp. 1928-s]MDF3126651.1 glycogen synthase [Rheinheimera sp. 1928-s]